MAYYECPHERTEKTKNVEQEGVSKMRTIESGKYKGKILSECPVSYLKWLVSHERVLALRNRWLTRDAKFLLEKTAEAASEVATCEGNADWDEWERSLEAARVARLDAVIEKHLASTPAKVDLGLKGHLSSSRGFSLMR